MANRVVTRTYRARICNDSQVSDDLDSLGVAASKLWTVGRWTAERVWDACGQIPTANALMATTARWSRPSHIDRLCRIPQSF